MTEKLKQKQPVTLVIALWKKNLIISFNIIITIKALTLSALTQRQNRINSYLCYPTSESRHLCFEFWIERLLVRTYLSSELVSLLRHLIGESAPTKLELSRAVSVCLQRDLAGGPPHVGSTCGEFDRNFLLLLLQGVRVHIEIGWCCWWCCTVSK